MGKGSAYLITDMNQPLGLAAGNALEIDECVQALRGDGPDDLMQITFALGASMLELGGVVEGQEAVLLQMEKINDGSAFTKFLEMVEHQGGETAGLESSERLAPAKKILAVEARKDGYIKTIDTYKIGRLIIELGGGRTVVGQPIDHTVGVIMKRKIGVQVSAGQTIAEVHSSGQPDDSYLTDSFADCFEIVRNPVETGDLIINASS
jgi:pyrimidine-nucleoside phosphorylase